MMTMLNCAELHGEDPEEEREVGVVLFSLLTPPETESADSERIDRLSGPSSSSCPSFCTQNRNDQRITSSITALLNKTDQGSTFLNSKHGKHLLG